MFIQEQRARRQEMKNVKEQLGGRQFYLGKVLDLLSGEITDLQEVSNGSYQAYAALLLLFCPDISQGTGNQRAAEPAFVEKIKSAIETIGTRNPLLKELYKESAFTLLEKVLASTIYADSLFIFVFHLSHLLLRSLLFPDSNQSYNIF